LHSYKIPWEDDYDVRVQIRIAEGDSRGLFQGRYVGNLLKTKTSVRRRFEPGTCRI